MRKVSVIAAKLVLATLCSTTLCSTMLCSAPLQAQQGAQSPEPIHHQLMVRLDPATGKITVKDRIRFPENVKTRDFLLNAALTLTSDAATTAVERLPLGEADSFFSINGTAALQSGLELARYRLSGETREVVLTYEGTFNFGLSDAKEEYTRGFRETVGIISEEGVYLAGSSFWVPLFSQDLVTFDVAVQAPDGWHVISQGDGSSREDGTAAWSSGGPMDEIYLVGGPLHVYRDVAGAVDTLVYLREQDEALAAKYLTTTAQYLEMYRGLIGAYPYGKFALVENFWETGFGMPTFTLLGPQVIRFPFILHSSYPHEILHNWWGNSVFVDNTGGNWCEGLTAYMADHLVQQQRGKGPEYRRSALQKYRDYVRDGNDFALREFRSRHSAATEAVGYGKTMMGFHMLRQWIGDEQFTLALQRFYRAKKGQRASFNDIRLEFEKLSGADLSRFFADWIDRPGAPDLRVKIDAVKSDAVKSDAAAGDGNDGWTLLGSLDQAQDGEPYAFEIPLYVETTAGTEKHVIPLAGRQTPLEIHLQGHRQNHRPLRLHVDPLFDVFRKLDPRETPPSIGQIFGQSQILALIPASAPETEQERYRNLMKGWVSDAHAVEIRRDDEIDTLPADRAVWILGRGNRFAELFASDPAHRLVRDENKIVVDSEEIPFANHSVVWVRRHPENIEKAVGWLVVEPAEAFPGMGRKLPHYGKYSYLGFVGDEPANMVKGQWAPTDSPLVVDLRRLADSNGDGEVADSGPELTAPEFEKRQALAELPPVFSQKKLMEHVAYLAAPELEGRGVGTAGLQKAADYVADAFAAAGLRPGGDDGTFHQRFKVNGPDGETEVSNVIGYIPGTKSEWESQSALLTAHYDHLGRGWPDARQGNAGKIHHGADDNASGVAILIELAKSIAAAEKPSRNLVFIAFTAEEAGRLGSIHYVEDPLFPVDDVWGIINMDTVGRLGDGKISVHGTGTASEWQHIFRGASFVTGVESRNVPGSAEGSDQWSFIQKGVPGVQLFTGPHEDYHRPSDTAEKVDGPGLVKIATFVKEGIVYLGERDNRMTVTIAGMESEAPPPPAGGRRVSFGSVPDFGFAGPGVKLSGVTPGSPAEKAGLQEGDVVLKIDGREVADLRAFSGILRELQPGQTVGVIFQRNGEEMTANVTVTVR